jgi:hypothetical protein
MPHGEYVIDKAPGMIAPAGDRPNRESTVGNPGTFLREESFLAHANPRLRQLYTDLKSEGYNIDFGVDALDNLQKLEWYYANAPIRAILDHYGSGPDESKTGKAVPGYLGGGIFESYSSTGERMLWYVPMQASGKEGHSLKLTPDQVAKYDEYGTFSDKKIARIEQERWEKKNNFYFAVNDINAGTSEGYKLAAAQNDLMKEFLDKYNQQRGEDNSLSWWKTFVPISFYQQRPGSNAQKAILSAVVDGRHIFNPDNRSSFGIVKPPTSSYVWTTQSGVGGIGNADDSGTITVGPGMGGRNDDSFGLSDGNHKNKLARLEQPLLKFDSKTFPPDLDIHSVTFTAFARGRKTRLQEKSANLTGMVTLPIPTDLSTGYGVQYSQVGLGVLGGKAQEFYREGGDVSSAVEKFKVSEAGELLGEQAKAIGASIAPDVAAIIGGVFGGLAGASVGAAASGVARGALSGAGIAVNPHMAVLFEGVNFRTHSFNYKFSPRSADESKILKEIIFFFKMSMHPTKDGLAFFNYPDEFEINFSHPDYLFNIGNSVLSSFNVNYQPDGGSHYHVNGAPVSLGLSLNFTEIEINTKEEIGGDPNTGKGGR